MRDANQIYLVDDEAAVRDALRFLLECHGFAVQAFDSGPALLQALQESPPDAACLLLDVRMEPMSGLRLFELLQAQGSRLPVIFLSGHGDISMAVEAVKQGAFDFVEKPFIDHALIAKLRAALALSATLQQQSASDGDLQLGLAELTERERQLMHLVAAGKFNKNIADEMHVSVRTVEVHRARVFAKLHVRSAAELATLLARLTPAR